MRKEETVLNELINWGQTQENIRAVAMTSSRTNPNASVDIFTDYDIELIVTDIQDFNNNDQWISHFGNVLANIKDKDATSFTQLVLYSDGVRIDFSIYTLSEFLRETGQSSLPEHWNIGYKILLDKDGVTQILPPPTHTLYNGNLPTEEEFTNLVKDFWWDTTYVAKSLWRDEIYYAKYFFDSLIHYEYLRKVIEWYIGIKHNWAVNPNKYGRWFKRYLDPEMWKQIENTFAESNVEKNWKALFATADLFRTLATEIAKQLNYKYQENLDRSIIDYLTKIQNLEKNATDF